MDITAVIPTMNEPAAQDVIKDVFKALEGHNVEVLVVDKSSDDTPIRAEKAGARVIYQFASGYGDAYITGFKHLGDRCEIIVMLDGDKTYDPLELPKLIEPIGKRMCVLFEDSKSIYLPELYDMNTTLEDVRDKIDWDPIIKENGKRIGWGLHIIYNTKSGKPEPGDMFWVDHSNHEFNWENQKGPHLHVILPNGIEWDIDSRANNCTMKDDKEHRCWVRTGTVPNITVGKNGNTCKAGAGSIQGGDYHGFLTKGNLQKHR